MKRRSVAIEVTPRCNQQCAYCYNAWRSDAPASLIDPSLSQLRRIVDGLVDDVAPDYLTLTGGEPLARHDILNLIDYINAAGVSVVLISNAGLVTEPLAAALAQRNLGYVQVTLAGADPQQHDRLCGAGSHAATLTGVAHLGAAGVAVGGSYLCTRQNYQDADAILGRLREAGATHHVAFNRFNPSGSALTHMHTLMPERYQTLQALASADAFGQRYNQTIHCTMPIPRCMLNEADYPQVRFGCCSAGTEAGEYAISANGDVKVCTVDGRALGNLLDTPLSQVITSAAVAEFRRPWPAFCADCPQAAACRGGCRAAARWAFGDHGELDPFLAQHVMVDYSERLRDNADKLEDVK